MKKLEEKILSEGKIYPGQIVKVDGFLNHCIDTNFLMEVGKEIAEIFKACRVDKILTIESSGIAIALAAAIHMNVPVVFAKKHKTINISKDSFVEKVYSYTHQTTYDVMVSREHIHDGENILIVDDVLAKGNALCGLCNIVRSAGADIVGAAIVIEKSFQGGSEMIRNMGVRVESLAVIESITENSIVFKKD